MSAAFCCGLSLPQRFHVDPPAFTQIDSEVSEPRHSCFSSKAESTADREKALEAAGPQA
jgi:hypothetical protein